MASATIALGFYVDSRDAIFPNVLADGIDLSGMTLYEANNALVSMGFESNADSVSATINFPNGNGFSISGNDAGFSLNAEEAARAAFEHGRRGSFFENAFTYLRSIFVETDLNGLSVAELDTDFVRGEVALHTRRFNEALLDNAYNIGGDSIVVTKGAGLEHANEDSVFELAVETLYRALEENAHLSSYYTPNSADTSDVDLDALFNAIKVEPVSAVYYPETFIVSQSVTGVSFDMAAARAMINNARIGEQIVIPLIFTEPEVTTEYLESRLFRDELASTTTQIDGSASRLNNIVLASNEVHETVLGPGDIFSFNDVVGQRTAARGFGYGGGFIDGELVQMIGGGICQVSSTIYDSVLHADLEVIERRSHSLPIAYLPLGHDATVFWGQTDFRFRNDTPYPIRIEATVEGRNLTVRLIGTRTTDNTIRIDATRSVVPYQTIERQDASVAPGQTVVYRRGQNGFVVNTYRVLLDPNGNQISRSHIARSAYRAQNRVVLIPYPDAYYPTDPPDETPPDRPDPTDPTEPTEPTDPPEPDPEPPTPEPPDDPPERPDPDDD